MVTCPPCTLKVPCWNFKRVCVGRTRWLLQQRHPVASPVAHPDISTLQMNVMHLHLSDWAGVRLAVAAYPELTAGLNGQFYTAADAADLVAYAKERAVRIVPEVRLTD